MTEDLLTLEVVAIGHTGDIHILAEGEEGIGRHIEGEKIDIQ